MKSGFLLAGVSALAVVSAQSATAQNFYFGLGYEAGTTGVDGPFSFDGEMSATSLLAGYRYGFDNGLFLGGEAETSLSSEYDGDGSGSGEIDRMSRARLLIGYDFGKANVFAAYGRAWAEGVLVPFGPESYDGKTWGVGGEYEISERFDVRLEGLADELENGSGYTYENRSVRAAAIVKF